MKNISKVPTGFLAVKLWDLVFVQKTTKIGAHSVRLLLKSLRNLALPIKKSQDRFTIVQFMI